MRFLSQELLVPPLRGSSEKCLPGVMKTEEPENQVTLVTQTICLAKKCLDLIVDALHAAVVDPVLPPCKNATLMAEKSSGHLPHLADRSEEHTSELQSPCNL